MEYAVRFQEVTKTFGKVTANHNISMGVYPGEILSLLGENGSGKTSLMNMLAGIYYPDSGQIYVNEKLADIKSPRDAYRYGIGMVHQHFKLVDVFTATENIALGLGKEESFDLKAIREKAREICERYHFDLNLDQKVYQMSVSQKQTLEIVKVLFRKANILILDEPTAVLTPQETERLFDVLRIMKKDGKSIILITHKLHEVLSVSDRVAILRKGEYIDSIATKDADENKLTEMMVGQKVALNIRRNDPVDLVKRLEVSHLSVVNKEGVKVLKDISFEAFGGEILGIAGVSGNGQKELLESIAGLQHTVEGSEILYYHPKREGAISLIGKSPKKIRNEGVQLSFVPEDRLGMGLVGSMGITENMLIKTYEEGSYILTDRKTPRQLAETITETLQVVTPSINTPVSKLSGGNVQKVLVGREIAASPAVLMTAYAVRGLDINTSYKIYDLLNEQKEKGVAVIYVGEDLDVLLELCDRILILCDGCNNGIVDPRVTSKEEVGIRMTRLQKNDSIKEPEERKEGNIEEIKEESSEEIKEESTEEIKEDSTKEIKEESSEEIKTEQPDKAKEEKDEKGGGQND